jgi:hypothetical protein
MNVHDSKVDRPVPAEAAGYPRHLNFMTLQRITFVT